MQNNQHVIRFDIVIPTRHGAGYAGHFKRVKDNSLRTIATVGKADDEEQKKVTMSIQKAHVLFGHNSDLITQKVASYLDIRITRGSMKPCDACTIAKAQQKNVAKTSSGEKTKDVNGRWYHDISTVKSRDKSLNVSTPQWHMIVDELSGLKYSQFYAKKSAFVEPMLGMMQKAQQNGKPVQFVRGDNS